MKSKSSTKFNKQASPYMYGAADNLKSVVNANAPQLQQTADTMSGFANTLGQRVFGANPLVDQAKGYASDVLGGRFLNGSPQLDRVVSQAREGVFDTVNSGFGRSGMAGGTGHMGALGRGIAQAETGLRYSDLVNQQNRMDMMANNAGRMSIADLDALPMYASLAGQGAAMPYLGANTLASGMGGLLGNQVTQTQRQGLGQTLMGLGGLGLQAFGMGAFGGGGGMSGAMQGGG